MERIMSSEAQSRQVIINRYDCEQGDQHCFIDHRRHVLRRSPWKRRSSTPTLLTSLSELNRIPSDPAESVDDDIAPAPLRDVSRDGLWCDGEPTRLVEQDWQIIV